MPTFDLSVVLGDVLGNARALVDREVAVLERLVPSLEKAERDRITNRWPEGMRWRALADDNFVRLKNALDLLDAGEIASDGKGRKIVIVRGGKRAA